MTDAVLPANTDSRRDVTSKPSIYKHREMAEIQEIDKSGWETAMKISRNIPKA